MSELTECELARDSLNINSYDEALYRLSRTPNGKLTTGEWSLSFSVTLAGFVMEWGEGGTIINIPTCPIRTCKDYTLGRHFCREHAMCYKEAVAGLTDGIGSSKLIRTIIEEMVKYHGYPYSWTPCSLEDDDDEMGESVEDLYSKVSKSPFLWKDSIYVTLNPGSHSFHFECLKRNDFMHSCADPSGCYRIGILHGVGSNYYCRDHYVASDISQKNNPHLVNLNKLKAMEILVRRVNGVQKLASSQFPANKGSAEEIALGRREFLECFNQWKTFLHAANDTPEKMVFSFLEDQISFSVNKGNLCYSTVTKKQVPICLYPFCGKKLATAISSAKIVCKDPDHVLFQDQLILLLPRSQMNFASGKKVVSSTGPTRER